MIHAFRVNTLHIFDTCHKFTYFKYVFFFTTAIFLSPNSHNLSSVMTFISLFHFQMFDPILNCSVSTCYH